MALTDDIDPYRKDNRLPRRGDKVIAAPNGIGCIAGTVVSYSAQRVSIQTDTGHGHGVVHPSFSRFTWSTRRKAWICWPLDVVREVRLWERLDDRLLKPNPDFAAIGDYVAFSKGSGGWVVRHVGVAKPFGESVGAVYQALKGYIVSTPEKMLEVDAADLVYDSDQRIWLRM